MMIGCMPLLVAMLAAQATPGPGPNSSTEPLAKEFSVERGRAFLDSAALWWQKEKKCLTCHTNVAYLSTASGDVLKRPAFAEIRKFAEETVSVRWEQAKGPRYDADVVVAAQSLAISDAETTGKLHPLTRKALDRMWTKQRADGSWNWEKCDWAPLESDDHYGVTAAILAAVRAPEGYAETPAAREGLEKARAWLARNPPTMLHHRAMLLWVSKYADGYLCEADRERTVTDLLALQRPDGGWATASLGKWKRTDGKEQDLETSDGYGTGFGVYLARLSDTPASDERLRKGIAWLKTHQRESGRWFTRSLNTDSKHYLTHVGTAFALLALHECGETGRSGARETIPLYACISVPPGESTPARYRELADAGFTMSLTGFPNLAEAIQALDAARGSGVTLFITCPELKREPAATVRRLAGHPALAGYHLQDEPSAADFPGLAAWKKTIQEIDPVHPCYINLNPIYAGPQHLGTKTYQEHVDRFVDIVQPSFISFDNYPTSFGKLEPHVFTNLEIISAAARGAGKPFWGFYQSVVWGKMPPRTLAHLRLESFSNLVYGAQCIQAFTYWMPGFPDHRAAPIGLDGKRTPVYDLVKTINGEIRAWSRVFKDARVVDVSHAGPALPPGTRPFAATRGVSGLDVGSGGAVVSFLKKGDATFVALLNKDLHGTLALKIRFDDPANVLDVRKDGVDQPVGGSEFSLEPGDLLVFQLPTPPAPEDREYSTLAGSRFGHADGKGVEAKFASPEGIAVDSKGNVYVTEYANSTIRRISSDGTAVTLAGRPGVSGWKDGPGGEALFSHPHGLAVSADGTVTVSDMKNHAIRRISPSGDVGTVAGKAGEPGAADGPGDAARFCQPEGVAVGGDGTIYVADTYNFTVRKISQGIVTTLAGKAGSPGDADGKGSAARFNMPLGVAVDGSGHVFVVDADYDGKPTGNCTVRRISPDGTVTTIAGQAGVSGGADGPGPAARFTKPVGIAATRDGTLYIADTGAHTIRRVGPQGEVTTVGGAFRKPGHSDGLASTARFSSPQAVAIGYDGTLYVADTMNHRVRKGILRP